MSVGAGTVSCNGTRWCKCLARRVASVKITAGGAIDRVEFQYKAVILALD